MKKNIVLSCVFACLSQAVFAKNTNKVTFDYSTMMLTSMGVYNPKIEGDKAGLNAELIARKHGMENLEKYFKSSCQGIDNSAVNVRDNWEENFHSQGTEIFSNGVLVVTLKAPLKQVFKTSFHGKNSIKTKEGGKILFSLPQDIPLEAIRCGTLELDLDKGMKLHVIPIEAIEAKASANITIIPLVYNNKTSTLELAPATKEKYSEVLQNSSLSTMKNIDSHFLPLSVSTNGQP